MMVALRDLQCSMGGAASMNAEPMALDEHAATSSPAMSDGIEERVAEAENSSERWPRKEEKLR